MVPEMADENSFNLSNVLKTVAPWIGTALGGPFAGMAVKFVADKLGIEEGTLEGVKAALVGMDASQMLALKNADVEFQAQMQKLGFDHIENLAKLENDDRASARNREIAVKDNTPKYMAYVTTFGFFGMLTMMMLAPIPQENRDILNIMLGSLGAAWLGINSYYFGSTRGSEVKSTLLANADPRVK